MSDGGMSFDALVASLDSIIGKLTVVYPALDDDSRDDEPDPGFATGGLSAAGILKRDVVPPDAAEQRRRLSRTGIFQKLGTPEVDLGDAPLELYERQVVGYTFEGLDGPDAVGWVAVVLWEHEYRDARWIDYGVPGDWLWIRRRGPLGLIVVSDFPHRSESRASG